jgi:hypothetical protein
LLAEGVEPELVVVEVVYGDAWRERECFWIAKLRTDGYDLTNVTAGGTGIMAPRTKEWCAKIGNAHRGKQVPAAVRSYFSDLYKARSDRLGCKYGHPWTPENTIYRVKKGRRYRVCRWCCHRHAAERRRARSLKEPVQTRCKRGHPLNGDNLRILIRPNKDGTRQERICRACVRLRNRKYKRQRHNKPDDAR